jgi:hypothetical protein
MSHHVTSCRQQRWNAIVLLINTFKRDCFLLLLIAAGVVGAVMLIVAHDISY